MNRGEIRKLIRTLADELTELPEGLFEDDDGTSPASTGLNSLINISQVNVELDLIDFIPWYFRKRFTFSSEAGTATYSIVTDLSITDHLLFETIIKGTTGQRADPLTYLDDPDDINDYENKVGATEEPRAFMYEDKDTIRLIRTPRSVYVYNGYYFKEIPALDHDSTDDDSNVATPHLPTSAHPLIALDVLKDWHIRSEEESRDIEERYNSLLYKVTYKLSSRQGFTSRRKRSAKEILNKVLTQ